MQRHQVMNSLLSGLAGAVALTATHESVRQMVPNAPRMDLAGRRGIARALRGAGIKPPHGNQLQAAALAGDLLSNTLYYSLVGLAGQRAPLTTGAILGALAGIGAVTLTPRLGLGRRPAGTRPSTQSMTFTWYLLGGLAAAATFACLTSPKRSGR